MVIDASFARISAMRIGRIKATILRDLPFYGILLGRLRFSLDESLETVCTDGERIYFNPRFLALIDDRSLRFILLHETLHLALEHWERRREYDPYIFDIASDIVVNSNILHSINGDESGISIHVPSDYQADYEDMIGTAPHQLPDGTEGYLYTVEQVYAVLNKEYGMEASESGDSEYGDPSEEDLDAEDDDSGDAQLGDEGDKGSFESGNPSAEDLEAEDDDSGDAQLGDEGGKGSFKSGKGRGRSGASAGTGMGSSTIAKGMLLEKTAQESGKKAGKGLAKAKSNTNGLHNAGKRRFDSHERWESKDGISNKLQRKYEWKTALRSVKKLLGSRDHGLMPAGAIIEMEMDERNARLDWKTLLHDFLSIDEKDYSFTPPDRRYDSSPFFLPDFNLEERKIKNILVFVDTSGSMEQRVVKEILDEIKAAISESSCCLKGWLGFFDAAVTKPVPIGEEDSIDDIVVRGGGGTSFEAVFEYIRTSFRNEIESECEEISAIVMITDGYCSYPDEDAAEDVPVLWVMTTDEEAPWGKTAHFYEEGGDSAGF